ncbi:MAG: nitroreductase/quinone reductase family protein [Thermomicrobiales bacterium]
MDDEIRQALARDRTIDITTIGRSSGQPHRIEMAFSNLDGEIYITGTPGKRDWYANVVANPAFTFHLKQSAAADLAAHATPITDPDTRRAILTRILANLGRSAQLETWMTDSPLIRVTFDSN